MKLTEVKLLLSTFGLEHSITSGLLIVGIIHSVVGLNAYEYIDMLYISRSPA